MKCWGIVDDDPRLHMVAFYESNAEEFVAAATRLWNTQLENTHLELAERKTSMQPPHSPPQPEAGEDGPEQGQAADIRPPPAWAHPPQPWTTSHRYSDDAGTDGQEGGGDVSRSTCRGLEVTLFNIDTGAESFDEVLTGFYEEHGENHGRPVYLKRLAEGSETPREVFVYYWDDRDGSEVSGWWFGASVGGENLGKEYQR
jgi:hypothetical protein